MLRVGVSARACGNIPARVHRYKVALLTGTSSNTAGRRSRAVVWYVASFMLSFLHARRSDRCTGHVRCGWLVLWVWPGARGESRTSDCSIGERKSVPNISRGCSDRRPSPSEVRTMNRRNRQVYVLRVLRQIDRKGLRVADGGLWVSSRPVC